MGNELKDIVERLCGYDDGWIVETAGKRADGGWDLIVQPLKKEEKQEEAHDKPKVQRTESEV